MKERAFLQRAMSSLLHLLLPRTIKDLRLLRRRRPLMEKERTGASREPRVCVRVWKFWVKGARSKLTKSEQAREREKAPAASLSFRLSAPVAVDIIRLRIGNGDEGEWERERERRETSPRSLGQMLSFLLLFAEEALYAPLLRREPPLPWADPVANMPPAKS